jgi:hypothetical protein
MDGRPLNPSKIIITDGRDLDKRVEKRRGFLVSSRTESCQAMSHFLAFDRVKAGTMQLILSINSE